MNSKPSGGNLRKSTRILLLAFVMLLAGFGATYLSRRLDQRDTLLIPAIADKSSVRLIELSSGSRLVKLSRLPDGEWSFFPPAGARADRLAVNGLLDAFSSDLVSVIPVDTEAGAAEYGLDPDTAIRVAFDIGSGSSQDIEIGSVQDNPDAGPDTFVRMSGADQVFRLTGHDLRRPFPRGLDSMRSSRLFSFGVGDVKTVTFSRLDGDSKWEAVTVTYEGDRKSPLARMGWRIVSPGGWEPGGIEEVVGQASLVLVDSWAESLPEGVSISSPVAKVTFGLVDGRTVEVVLSAESAGFVWVATSEVAGFARLRSADAGLLAKSLFDLADLSLVKSSPEEIESVLIEGEGRRLAIRREGAGIVSDGMPAPLDRSEVETWLRSISEMDASGVISGKAAASAFQSDLRLKVTRTDRSVISVSFGPRERDGRRHAMVDGLPGIAVVTAAELAPLDITVDRLMARSVFPRDSSTLRKIRVWSPVFGTAVIRPPEKGEKNFSVQFGNSPAISSQAVTSIATAAISMRAHSFVDDVRPSRIRADHLSVTFTAEGGDIVLKVSPAERGGGFVAATTGNRFMDSRAFVIPASMIDAVSAVFAIREL